MQIWVHFPFSLRLNTPRQNYTRTTPTAAHQANNHYIEPWHRKRANDAKHVVVGPRPASGPRFEHLSVCAWYQASSTTTTDEERARRVSAKLANEFRA